jgi:hypothetical protein
MATKTDSIATPKMARPSRPNASRIAVVAALPAFVTEAGDRRGEAAIEGSDRRVKKYSPVTALTFHVYRPRHPTQASEKMILAERYGVRPSTPFSWFPNIFNLNLPHFQ